jgi:hypothetical protein
MHLCQQQQPEPSAVDRTLPGAELSCSSSWCMCMCWPGLSASALCAASLPQLFRAPYGDGFMGIGMVASQQQRQLWEIVRQHHVHIAW